MAAQDSRRSGPAWQKALACGAIGEALPGSAVPGPDGEAPLSGWTVAVKDMIDIAGARCGAGLPPFADRIAGKDAALVMQLRRAGAAIVATTTSDAGGIGVTTPAVTHPLWPDRVVGGSSGGAAVAVAVGLARLAVGTDTGGSCRIPAACCGIAGFKPTRGRLPMDGIRPLVSSLDHAGLMAHDAADIDAAWRALIAEDEPPHARAPETIRIGFDDSLLADCAPAQRRAMRVALRAIESAGYRILDACLAWRRDVPDVHRDIFCFEAFRTHERFGVDWRRDYPPVARRALLYGSRMDPAAYDRALAVRRTFCTEAEALFDSVDLLVLPTLPVAPPHRGAREVSIDGARLDVASALLRNCCPFNHTGQPALSIPVTHPRDPDEATSLQIVGRGGADAMVLRAGAWLETLFTETGPAERR